MKYGYHQRQVIRSGKACWWVFIDVCFTRMNSSHSGIQPISAETILCTPSAASRDKSPGRWSLVKDLHPNRHSPMHQNSPYPSTTSLQPYVSQNHHRPCEEPARRDRWMDDTHSSVLQVAVLLAMPAPHPPLSGTTPASMCADAERLPHGGVVPDMCLGVAHIPFKSEADTTQSNNPSYSIPLPSPTSARVQQSLFPSVALVRLTHPIF